MVSSFLFRVQDTVSTFWCTWSTFLWSYQVSFHQRSYQVSFHQLHQISDGNLLVFYALEVLNHMLKPSQTFFDFLVVQYVLSTRKLCEDPGYLEVCTEGNVAYIVIDTNVQNSLAYILVLSWHLRTKCHFASSSAHGLTRESVSLCSLESILCLLESILCSLESFFRSYSSWRSSSVLSPAGRKTNILKSCQLKNHMTAIVFSLIATRRQRVPFSVT